MRLKNLLINYVLAVDGVVMTYKDIVVDANIARAASGDSLSKKPGIGCAARSLLNFVKDNGVSLIFTVDLTREWNEHQSIFSKRIKAALQSRNKIIRVPAINSDRREMNKVLNNISDCNIREEVSKDIHLLEGAFYRDCYLVVSNDKKIVRHFRENYNILNVLDKMDEVKWFKVEDNELVFSYVKNECSIVDGEFSISPLV